VVHAAQSARCQHLQLGITQRVVLTGAHVQLVEHSRHIPLQCSLLLLLLLLLLHLLPLL
jgi:hypothetical protein